MKKIILATGNKGKVRELNEMLKGSYIIVSQSEMQVTEVPETGDTFVENALIKARNASLQSNLPALADDSGLEVEALNGEPGIYSARYAGEMATDKDNIEKLLMKMSQHSNRKAHFCCAMAFVKSASDQNPVIVIQHWNGKILRDPIGDNGFGYDPIFYLPEYGCSSAQLQPEIKNEISHRGRALSELLNLLMPFE